ncbi:MAG: hypothetical protein K5798_03825 [Nitrosopumilus sp.]|uniref:hypothetical protein n=1 Tax=Nitrosopumilus sp. TaxID=2024843 RepID=UPI00242F3B5D|nr:hypothetical protein [Nitrosopumilus sp.]MCV0366381.1 hypothetical protein [Nitrosopumilus sp.]
MGWGDDDKPSGPPDLGFVDGGELTETNGSCCPDPGEGAIRTIKNLQSSTAWTRTSDYYIWGANPAHIPSPPPPQTTATAFSEVTRTHTYLCQKQKCVASKWTDQGPEFTRTEPEVKTIQYHVGGVKLLPWTNVMRNDAWTSQDYAFQ